MEGLSRREKFHAFNTLAAVPLLFVGKSVLIDMNNETSVAGKITSADGFMNITLEQVVFIDQKNVQYEFDNFLIPARNIRQVHFGRSVNISFEIKKFFDKIGYHKKTPNLKMRTFKNNRTLRKHNEILHEIKNKQDKF